MREVSSPNPNPNPDPDLGDARCVEAEEAVVEERREVLGHLLALLVRVRVRVRLRLRLSLP
jgi:hypothetical protein